MTPLSAKHKITLGKIFCKPIPSSIKFTDVEALFLQLGAEVDHRGKTSGSRICFDLNGRKLILHRPHPGNELHKYAVRDLKKFLEKMGVIP